MMVQISFTQSELQDVIRAVEWLIDEFLYAPGGCDEDGLERFTRLLEKLSSHLANEQKGGEQDAG